MNTTTQFTNGVLFELRPRNVIVTRNGANLQYYEVLRIVFRNWSLQSVSLNFGAISIFRCRKSFEFRSRCRYLLDSLFGVINDLIKK